MPKGEEGCRPKGELRSLSPGGGERVSTGSSFKDDHEGHGEGGLL